MKYKWEAMNEQQKIESVQKELELITHTGTTKGDLINMLRWLWDKFEIVEEE